MTNDKKRGEHTFTREDLMKTQNKLKHTLGGTKIYRDWRKAAWAQYDEMKRKAR